MNTKQCTVPRQACGIVSTTLIFKETSKSERMQRERVPASCMFTDPSIVDGDSSDEGPAPDNAAASEAPKGSRREGERSTELSTAPVADNNADVLVMAMSS
jgi:hypothetical protein